MKRGPPPMPEPAADAVLAAVKAKDEAALRLLATKDQPDPWLVADELIRRGEHDAAEAFAKAAPRVDTEALPAYVASRRGKPDDPARRERLTKVNVALMAGKFGDAIETLGAEEAGALEDVAGIRLAMGRALALRPQGQLEASAAAFLSVGEAAERIGWLARAAQAFHESSVSAYGGSAFAAALQASMRFLSICERRADKEATAWALSNVGALHQSLGDYAKELSFLERALAAKEALGDKAGAGALLGAVGAAHISLKDYAGALAPLERALAVHESLGNKASAAATLVDIGTAHRSLGDTTKALHFLERGLSLAEECGHRPWAANALQGIGLVQQKRGDYAKALSAHERALAVQESLGDKAGVAGTLVNIGNAYASLEDNAKALHFLERGLSLAEEVGQREWAANALQGIGLVHKALGESAKALSTYERALATYETLGDKAGAAGTLTNIGSVHSSLGHHAEAMSFYERALAAQETLGDKAGAALTLGNIGNVHEARGEYAEALPFYVRALAAQEALGEEAEAATALGNLGNVYRSLGEYAKALSCHERALAAREALGNKKGAAATLGYIGAVHAAVGDYAKALSFYERGLAAQEAMGDEGGATLTLGNLGNVYSAFGEYAKALSIYERALAAKEARGDTKGAADTLGNIGAVHADLGDYAKALSCHERALAVKEALGDKAGAALTLGNIGLAYVQLGDYEKALSIHERALAAMEALGNKAGAAHALGNIALVHEHLGDHEKALSIYERVLAAKEAVGDKAGAASTLSNIGLEHFKLGVPAKALPFLERAARSARRLRAVPTLVDALKVLAMVHLVQGAPGQALSEAREALRESETLLGGLGDEEGALARARQTDLFDVGALAAAREGNLGEAFSFLENGRAGALLDSLDKRDMLRWKAETLPPELRAAEAKAHAGEKRARAAHEKALAGEDRAAIATAARALDDALEDARAAAARIQRETKRAAGLYYPRARTLEEVQETLEEGDALVLYGLCFDEALALVVGREEARVVALGQRADVEAACEALDARDPDADPSAALAALRKALVAPLRLKEGVKRVVVSPAGRLALLPYGALFDVPVAVTPSGSTQALLLEEERGRGEGILALGNPDYAGATAGTSASAYRGRPLAALPATRAEAEAIATSGALLGAKASEAGLREALGANKHWRAVHLACHGLVDGKRPLQSSLALTRAGDDDGFLTAREVLSMKIPSDLVTLSACETATGDVVSGEGIVGLTRAFMYAGTPRVLCSLWKVDDQATAALMTKFYELWSPKDGKPALSTAEALRKAQDFVKSQEKWKHPYYWAAWVLWGLPS